jgi:S1-C subfamily serine protease
LLTGVDQLGELVRRGGLKSFVVVDINSGKAVQVEIAGADAPADASRAADAGTAPSPAPAPTPTAGRQSLGVSAEPVNLGSRTALKVVRVTPDGPAARAGIEVGDVLVSANGAAITGPEQLAAALHKSGPTLTLQVRDVRSGKDTPVEVSLGGSQRPRLPADVSPTPSPAEGSGASADRLGAISELTFYDTEAAVKLTELDPSGPAARAGLQVGTVILKADGKPMLHPNDLIEASRKAGNSIRLTVVDPRSNRSRELVVDLRSR